MAMGRPCGAPGGAGVWDSIYPSPIKARYAYNTSWVGHRCSPFNDLLKISLLNAGVARL